MWTTVYNNEGIPLLRYKRNGDDYEYQHFDGEEYRFKDYSLNAPSVDFQKSVGKLIEENGASIEAENKNRYHNNELLDAEKNLFKAAYKVTKSDKYDSDYRKNEYEKGKEDMSKREKHFNEISDIRNRRKANELKDLDRNIETSKMMLDVYDKNSQEYYDEKSNIEDMENYKKELDNVFDMQNTYVSKLTDEDRERFMKRHKNSPGYKERSKEYEKNYVSSEVGTSVEKPKSKEELEERWNSDEEMAAEYKKSLEEKRKRSPEYKEKENQYNEEINEEYENMRRSDERRMRRENPNLYSDKYNLGDDLRSAARSTWERKNELQIQQEQADSDKRNKTPNKKDEVKYNTPEFIAKYMKKQQGGYVYSPYKYK
jgi:hypothetical protein